MQKNKYPETRNSAHSMSDWDKLEAITNENEDYIRMEDVDLLLGFR